MISWFIVGFIVWTLCILLMLAVFHGGHRIRGHGYERKLYLIKKVIEAIRNQSCDKRNGRRRGLSHVNIK